MSNEELKRIKSDYLTKLKKLKLLEAGISYEDVDIYVKYLKADDEKELEREAQELVADIRVHNTATDVHHDKTIWKPF